MATPDKHWPLYAEPATKGDLIAAMVATRSCVVDIYVALRAFRRGDLNRMDEVIADLDLDDENLSKLIDKIGGRKQDA